VVAGVVGGERGDGAGVVRGVEAREIVPGQKTPFTPRGIRVTEEDQLAHAAGGAGLG
jgi:hypothetical protein